MAKKGRLKEELTRREEELMQYLWTVNKPICVRDLLELYPESHPHFNTVSTVVRGLEEKGYVDHLPGAHYRYYAIRDKESVRSRTVSKVIGSYFNNSYLGAVSTFVEEEKISVDELKELIKMIESK